MTTNMERALARVLIFRLSPPDWTTTDGDLQSRIARPLDPKRCNSDHKLARVYTRHSSVGKLAADTDLCTHPMFLSIAMDVGLGTRPGPE